MSSTPTRPPLQPASPIKLNSRSFAPPTSRKRKRDDTDKSLSYSASFTAEAVLPVNTHATSTFAPVITIARSSLPLAALNYNPLKNSLPLGYLFDARIAALEEKDTCVLIARLCPNGGLYAIEKATKNAFIAWPLQTWVTEEWCRDARQGDVRLPDNDQFTISRPSHSRSASLSSNAPVRQPTPSSPPRAKNRKGALARMSILTPRDESLPKSADTTSSVISAESPALLPESIGPAITYPITPGASDPPNPFETQHHHDEMRHGAKPATSEPSEPTTEAVPPTEPQLAGDHVSIQTPFEQLHSQYLDNLYISRASLAFYAKGPLSRARAQAKQADNAFDITELKDFYQTLVLSVKKMDSKYKLALPEAIQKAVETQGDGKTPKRGRKKANTMKLGKGGLYPDEYDLIVKHWNDRELSHSSATTPDSRFRSDVEQIASKLRTRETEMQIVLLLEIILLQRLAESVTQKESKPTDVDVKQEEQHDDVGTVLANLPQKKQKKRDLEAELESLIDRLCIWHTVALEILESPEKRRSSDGGSSEKSKDKLREFCAEVIIPFYSTRLPLQAKSICRKLGGPDLTPQRPRTAPKAMKASTGAALNGTKPKPTTKRSLERVLSEDKSLRQPSPPVLSRSATTSIVPTLKQEPSDIAGRPMSRSGMQKSVSFTNREIDLVSAARVQDAKKRKLEKLAQQKDELKAAIDALKKPNRTHAAQAFMDEVETRQNDLNPRLFAPGHPIQITATPKRSRNHRPLSQPEPELSVTLPLDDPASFIPSSTIKPHLVQRPTHLSGSSKKRAVLSAIHDTPSRLRTTHADLLALPQPTLIEATPATNRLRTDLLSETPLKATTKSGKPVLFTPVKRKEVSVEDAFRDAPEIPELAGKAMDRVMGGRGVEGCGVGDRSVGGGGGLDIYQALGWDDEFDD